SKWPVQALALARAGLDVRVIHLVRDVRGVSYSLGKQQVARPHAVDETDFMWRNAPAGAAPRWVTCPGPAELLRSCGLRVTRVHYEDFIREPRRTVEAALSSLGLPVDPAQLSHIGDGRVVLGHTHGLSGNPSRFRYGEIVLRADEAWRDQMRRRDRRIVTMVALPFLLRYAPPPPPAPSPPAPGGPPPPGQHAPGQHGPTEHGFGEPGFGRCGNAGGARRGADARARRVAAGFGDRAHPRPPRAGPLDDRRGG